MELHQVNMQDLEESLKFNQESSDYDYEKMERELKQRDEEFRCRRLKEYDIKRLGGLLAYEDYTEEKFKNKQTLKLLENFPNENYFLFGPAGTGKTHAATVALRKVPNGELFRMSRISRVLRRCEGPDDEVKAIKQLSQVPMLLDDLGSEKMTEFLQSNFFEIIDRRVQYKINGLIITSNLSLDQLAPVIGDRTASRIAGLVTKKNILQFSGKDYRWQK